MGIVQITTDITGQINVNPRRVKIITTDSLATVTAAGYLNSTNLEGYTILPTDVIDMRYSYVIGGSAGTYEVFTPSISNGIITLTQWANPGDVLLPVVSGNVATFNGTSGQIKDSGVAFSNGTDTVASLFHGTATVGDFVTVNNANKTIQDSGAAPSAASQPFVVMSPGSLTSGNFPRLNDANGTLNTGKAPSDATKTYVVMSPGSLTSGNFPAYGDANGTLAAGLPPTAAAQSYVVVSPGSLTSGNLLKANDANGTIADSGIPAANITAIQTVSVTMNTAAVTGAYATPFQLIAAPGSGKTIMVLNTWTYTASTGNTAYATGGNAVIQYGNSVHGAGTSAIAAATIAAAQITAASSQIFNNAGYASATVTTGNTNQGVFFSNQTGAFTNGTGTNIVITLQYLVLTASV